MRLFISLFYYLLYVRVLDLFKSILVNKVKQRIQIAFSFAFYIMSNSPYNLSHYKLLTEAIYKSVSQGIDAEQSSSSSVAALEYYEQGE